MGLAASQARFLCITARKADCEYKTTALAQEKLDITKQLSDISTNYAQAMNATKLIWQNDALANDYGVSYSLLMMPTAANDFNPYMITSPSGAIVLNSEYAAAAKAAGISKAGGVGSQSSRDKFIAALAHQGLITEPTADEITKFDYKVDPNHPTDANGKIVFANESSVTINTKGVIWNPAAGMGAEPMDKDGAQAVTLPELLLSETIGKDTVDWAKMFVADDQITEKEYKQESERLIKLINAVSNSTVNKDVIDEIKRDYNNFQANLTKSDGTVVEKDSQDYKDECAKYEDWIICLENASSVSGSGHIMYNGEIYEDKDGHPVQATTFLKDMLTYFEGKKSALIGAASVSIEGNINTSANHLTDSGKKYSVVQNGMINHYADEIKAITLADVISGNVVLMTQKSTGVENFKKDIMKLLESMVATLGYSKTDDLYGKGLYVDDASRDALEFAYEMIDKTFLRTNANEIQDVGSRYNPKSMTENSAYLNAINSNRISSDDKNNYYAVSLSNMMSAFLTYYENALSGASSPYAVGVTLSSQDINYYVTDDLGYYYMAQTNEDATVSAVAKSADFYDQVYNNILERGWREDAAIEDAEYLEAALKDGRYSMSSLNQDGYYYQTRYNETGYMVEVSDTDAIARAEAEFSSMKAQLTYKEDTIDLKTKKLDAEISSLSAEYDTVKNLISKTIEKTFAMFQN